MTTTLAATAAPPTAPSGRDRAIDVVRALCIIGVVVLHAMMVGVGVGDAGPSFVNASDGTWWIVPLSWVLQVMPLFFVIGGFSGATAFRRGSARGGDGAGFVAGRLHRLLLPAIVTVAAAGVLLTGLAAAGVAPGLVALAGFRFAQPLWFLGVFLVCQALLPSLLRLHERAPLPTIAALAAAAVTVDVARIVSGADALGYLNLAFVWLTLQQLGFFLADGRIDALSARTRRLAAAAAVAALAASFALGIHSPDLVANINPPTTALLLVGVAHTALFSLLRGQLDGLATRRVPAAVTRFVTPRATTVYLWHMPVLLCLAGLSAVGATLTGIALPAIDGLGWWITRPAWLALALAVTAAIAVPLARIEMRGAWAPARSNRRVAGAVLAGALAVAMLLVAGTSPLTAALAVVLFAFALRLAHSRVAKPRAVGRGALG